MQKQKLFAGSVVRGVREKAGLTQVALAKRLRISSPYLAQIEGNQRPLTATLLIEISRLFRIDPVRFSNDSADRLLFDLQDAVADPLVAGNAIAPAELRLAVQQAPNIARAFVALQSEHRALMDRYHALDTAISDTGDAAAPIRNFAYDEVRDFFHAIGNYVDPLDRAAEALADEIARDDADIHTGLVTRLARRHGLIVEPDRTLSPERPILRVDRAAGRLVIDALASPATQTFQLAHQLARLEVSDIIETILASAGFRSTNAAAVCRLSLANYFAGALMLPYARFYNAARSLRHDVELLAVSFGASFEQICHRLSTMQRPGVEGIPFYFLRVDRAGNITKRHSATRLQFARYGGACPLWNVHEAFETPDRMLVQIAEMPDGIRYLSLAQCVTKPGLGFSGTSRRYAIGLGCEIAYAADVVYADAVDWRSPRRVTPIGSSCRLCERPDCQQRAMPPAAREIVVDTEIRHAVPYRLADAADTKPSR